MGKNLGNQGIHDGGAAVLKKIAAVDKLDITICFG
jgi:uncharacterized protein (DUF2164 family)